MCQPAEVVLPHLDLGDLELEVLEVADPDFRGDFHGELGSKIGFTLW